MTIEELLQLTIERNASDLHLVPGYNPSIRINNVLYPLLNYPKLSGDNIQAAAMPILGDEQKENLLANKELDFGYTVGENRFRCNYYYTRSGLAAAFRLVPGRIKTYEELGLPSIMGDFTKYNQGLVLLTGPTGEGKSTTLASMVNDINQNSQKHIITIEDPIEFVYPEGKSIISQRELHENTHSMSLALRSVLREDPDIVLVGEMRDYETIQSVLTIAETGHLVFSTLHTKSTPEAIDRIIDVFPSHQQNQVRNQLSTLLISVVAQRLLPAIDGNSRLPALEILINTAAIASLIREGKNFMIDNVLETSEESGMILFEKYLARLYHSGKVTKETAVNHALRPFEILKFIE